MWPIRHRPRRSRQIDVFHISDDTNNFGRNVWFSHEYSDTLSDWIFSSEVKPCHDVADNHDIGLFGHLSFREKAAADQRNIHGPKITVVDDPDVDNRTMPIRKRRPSLDRKIGSRAGTAERQET